MVGASRNISAPYSTYLVKEKNSMLLVKHLQSSGAQLCPIDVQVFGLIIKPRTSLGPCEIFSCLFPLPVVFWPGFPVSPCPIPGFLREGILIPFP